MSCFLSESCLMLFAIDGITFFVEHTFSLGSFFVDDLPGDLFHFQSPTFLIQRLAVASPAWREPDSPHI